MFEVFTSLHDQIMDPDRFPIAVLALALAGVAGIITGPMHGNANPFFWLLLNGTLGAAGNRLDRRGRRANDLLARGLVFSFLTVFLAGIAGTGGVMLAESRPLWGITEILLLSLILTGGSVWYALLKLYFALRDSKMGRHAYYIVARSSRIDLSGSDDFTITRIGMGFAARSFDKGVVAPVVWYLIGGLAGAYVYAGLAWLSWRFGKEGFSKGFGKAPVALEMLLGFIPSSLAGCLMAAAGLLTPTGGMTRAFLSLLSPGKRAPYAEGGTPLSAMAYALDVSLGGPVTDLDGSALKRQWTGPENATARLEAYHLGRALYIHLMAYLLFAASLMAAILWAGRFF